MQSHVDRSLQYLGDQMQRMEDQMIDPREFGKMEGAVQSLKNEVDQIRVKQAQMDEKLDLVLEKLSEAKGGWRILMMLGGAAGALGAALTWFFTHTITVGPK